MEFLELKGKKRRETGKRAAKHLRVQGELPAIFYGEGFTSLPLAVLLKDFQRVVSTPAGTNVIVRLEIEGEESENAIIKEMQRDPIKDHYLHVDFLKIALDEEIETSIPLMVVGASPGVKEGGVLQHSLWEIQVKALPRNLPNRLEIDIGNLAIGDTLRVSDLTTPEGVEILTSSEEMVASVVPPTELKEEELVEEEVEPEVIGEKKEAEAEVPEAKEESKEGTEEKPK